MEPHETENAVGALAVLQQSAPKILDASGIIPPRGETLERNHTQEDRMHEDHAITKSYIEGIIQEDHFFGENLTPKEI